MLTQATYQHINASIIMPTMNCNWGCDWQGILWKRTPKIHIFLPSTYVVHRSAWYLWMRFHKCLCKTGGCFQWQYQCTKLKNRVKCRQFWQIISSWILTQNSLDNFPIVHSSQFVDDQRLAILEYMLCKIFTQVHRVVLLLDESFCVEDIGPNIK